MSARDISPQEPRLEPLGLEPVRPPCAQDLAVASAKIDSLFGRYGSGTSGVAVRVVKNGLVVHAGDHLMAKLENPAPITPDTRFDIGSNSKQFTAFAIALLAAEGRESTSTQTSIHTRRISLTSVHQ